MHGWVDSECAPILRAARRRAAARRRPVCARVRANVRACMRACVLACVRACMCVCVRAFLPAVHVCLGVAFTCALLCTCACVSVHSCLDTCDCVTIVLACMCNTCARVWTHAHVCGTASRIHQPSGVAPMELRGGPCATPLMTTAGVCVCIDACVRALLCLCACC